MEEKGCYCVNKGGREKILQRTDKIKVKYSMCCVCCIYVCMGMRVCVCAPGLNARVFSIS